MKLVTTFSLFLLLCLPLNVLAEIPEQLKEDFKLISGTIIMPVGEEFLVDLDASVNLQEGDILTLIMAGEKVIHPETKEVLGTLDVVKGYFQVTQVKSGYSYIKSLSAGITAKKGDQVKRFEQTPTRFKTTQPANNLAEELEIALPHLNWLSETDQTKSELIFLLDDKSLKITNSKGTELKIYPYNEGQLSVPMTGVYQAGSFGHGKSSQKKKSLLNQAVDSLASTAGFGKKDKRLENPGITQSQQLNDGIWVGPNLEGNPIGMAVADFDGDGLLETAVAMEDHLQILRISNGKLSPVTNITFSSGVHLLSLDTADIDSNGLPELYLSANVGTEISSQVVDFNQGAYQLAINRIPWFLRVVDLPHEGLTLVGQTLSDSENPLNGQPFRIERSGNQLNRGTGLSLPANLNLFSFTPFKGTNNDLLYAYISTGDYLHVNTPQGADIWESTDHFGGTEVFFYNVKEIDTELRQPIYIQQRLLTLPSGEILAAQNEGFRALERYRDFDKSRVVALKWDGFALQESWSTVEQSGYLADFNLADADNDGENELVMVIKYSQKNLLQKGRSAVVIYELKQ